ncbi:CPBP family intramembrane glutamic endopeptidase [Listeria booriae]|uniref:CPBP family intramembrane metalloprotease n=1 Tax=Listeria booriae TaxID=1552123 RepID=A0A7X0ZSR7_9LIST|nr:CPBP family intramembrane glutamic endopeptidase [Listeria booriae]MBC2309827.1 CPBP family intramembrane metalloprotease [Listeria booriae]
MANQVDVMRKMTKKEITRVFFIQNGLLILLGIGIIFISTGILQWMKELSFAWQAVCWAVGLALVWAAINIALDRVLPERFTDDGSLNKLIFKDRKLLDILLLCVLIGFTEEFIFRGVIQFYFGFWASVILFVLVHFRYLNKVYLLFNVTITSIIIAGLFQFSNQNLISVIMFHILFNFIGALDMRMRYQNGGGVAHGEERRR